MVVDRFLSVPMSLVTLKGAESSFQADLINNACIVRHRNNDQIRQDNTWGSLFLGKPRPYRMGRYSCAHQF